MSTILNIETSSKHCSVAVSHEGMIEYHRESEAEMDHSRELAPFVADALDHLGRRGMELDAVAVSMGPGSYTGLRIGLSLAKGLCFASPLPLIGLSTLEVLAVKAMFGLRDAEGDELLIPLIDARRMEVYTAAYDFSLQPVLPPQAMILDQDSFKNLLDRRKCCFIGDGLTKAMEVIKHPNALFLTNAMPTAMDMTALAEKHFREKRFEDTAYCTPIYIKEYQATVSRNKVLAQ